MKIKTINDENVLAFFQLSSENYYLLESNHHIPMSYDYDKLIYYNDNYYKMVFAKKECDNIYLIILVKITRLDNSSNDPKEPLLKDEYYSCPTCKFFDVDKSFKECPVCKQKLLWK